MIITDQRTQSQSTSMKKKVKRPWRSGIILACEFDDLRHENLFDDFTLHSRSRSIRPSVKWLTLHRSSRTELVSLEVALHALWAGIMKHDDEVKAWYVSFNDSFDEAMTFVHHHFPWINLQLDYQSSDWMRTYYNLSIPRPNEYMAVSLLSAMQYLQGLIASRPK